MDGRNYSYAELHAMQQDAVRRVMEMQRIADERLRRSSGRRDRPERRQERSPKEEGRPAPGDGKKGGASSAPPPLPAPRPAPGASFFTAGALEGFMKRLGLETDQLILLGLLLLLIDEGADASLILAVFYLLL